MPELDKATIEELLSHVRGGMRPGAAGEALGFTREQIFDRLDEDEDFFEAVSKAQKEATEHVEEALYQAAVSGNITAARIWLERTEPRKSKELVPIQADTHEPGFDQELADLNKLASGREE